MLKRIFIILLVLLSSESFIFSQVRYFEFRTDCNTGHWQDTSFIAATNNPAVIDTVLVEFAKPFNQRKFINGSIGYGNGGYNHNAGHWFSWYFLLSQWDLADLSTELCDGCPYSDVDADTAYWVGVVGRFCPWTARPVREVLNPSGMGDRNVEEKISIYPNPSVGIFTVDTEIEEGEIEIYDPIGEKIFGSAIKSQISAIDLSALANGVYFLRIRSEKFSSPQKLVIQK